MQTVTQVISTQVITENVLPEDKQLKESPNFASPFSDAITRNPSEFDLKSEAPQAGILSATANILKSGVGTGILFLPSVFQACGIALSIGFMLVCALVCYFCWSLVGKIIRYQESVDPKNPENRNLTLEAVAGIFFGNKAKVFLEVCTYIYAYSTCFGYSIFIYQALEQTIPNHIITLFILLAIYLPLSCYKQIDKLSIFTYIALAATIFTLLVIIAKSCYVIDTTEIVFSSLNQFKITELPLQFGVFSFAYDVNGVYTEVHASMKDKTQFDKVLLRYLIIFCGLGIFVGTMGYIAFGDSTEPVIFVNIGEMNGLGTALAFLYSVAELSSILLYSFTVAKCFDRLVNSYIFKKQGKCQSFMSELTVRLLLFLSFSFLALYFDKIGATFNILGCVFCTILTYICPLVLYRKALKLQAMVKSSQQQDVEKNANQPQIAYLSTHYIYTVLGILCALFGLLGGISGLISTIIDLQKNGI